MASSIAVWLDVATRGSPYNETNIERVCPTAVFASLADLSLISACVARRDSLCMRIDYFWRASTYDMAVHEFA